MNASGENLPRELLAGADRSSLLNYAVLAVLNLCEG